MSRHRIPGSHLVLSVLFCVVFFPNFHFLPEHDTFRVQANEATGSFPYEITFHLSAAVAAGVKSVELEYGVEKTACTPFLVRAVPDLPEAEQQPGQVVATWTWDMRRSGSLPPGARIWWRWHVTAESGESWDTPDAWFTFVDDRYDWQTLSEGLIQVHWYNGNSSFGQQMLQTAVEAQARFLADPAPGAAADAGLEKPVHIYFYADASALQAASLFTDRWAGGLAFPDFATVLIAADPQSQDYGQSAVKHELMHLVVYQLTFNCAGDVPRWVDEGLAMWSEGEPDPEQQKLLDEAISRDKLLSLRSLNSSFSAHPSRAQLAYAQSYSVVVWLIGEYGQERILDLLAIFRQGATYDDALQQIYGVDTDGVEDLWRAGVGAAPRATVAAPVASPSPVPTLALWSGVPMAGSATATSSPSPLPSPTPPPTGTLAPTPTEGTATPRAPTAVVAAVSPLPGATARPLTRPTPIGGLAPESDTSAWLWYALGGGAVFVGLVVVVLIRGSGRRR